MARLIEITVFFFGPSLVLMYFGGRSLVDHRQRWWAVAIAVIVGAAA